MSTNRLDRHEVGTWDDLSVRYSDSCDGESSYKRFVSSRVVPFELERKLRWPVLSRASIEVARLTSISCSGENMFE